MKMAEQNKKNINPSVGFYDEPGFVSLTTSLRKISGDDTIPTDNYVDIYKNIYDLITPDAEVSKGGVIDVQLSQDKSNLIIFYADNTNKKLPIDDYALFQTYYEPINNLIYFILKNGQKITLDLNFLQEQFVLKTVLENEIKEIKNDIQEIENKLNEGTDVIWKSF